MTAKKRPRRGTTDATGRDHPVAGLRSELPSGWDDLIATGRVILAEDEVDVAAEVPVDHGIDASAMLASMRGDER